MTFCEKPADMISDGALTYYKRLARLYQDDSEHYQTEWAKAASRASFWQNALADIIGMDTADADDTAKRMVARAREGLK